jgi:hypothetical protein
MVFTFRTIFSCEGSVILRRHGILQ